MRNGSHIPVREHQRMVLLTLRCARKPLSPAEIASRMNRAGQSHGLPDSTPIDVEASIAALMMRPDLAGFVSCTTRLATPVEQGDVSRRRLGALGAVVILSACTTLPPPSAEAPPARAVSYFGNVMPIAKPAAPDTRPLFAGTVYTSSDVPILSEADVVQYAAKTPVADVVAGLSYFSDDSTREYPARAEADMAPPEFLAKLDPVPGVSAIPRAASASSFAFLSRPPALRTFRAPGSVGFGSPWELTPTLPTLSLALDASPSSPRVASLPASPTQPDVAPLRLKASPEFVEAQTAAALRATHAVQHSPARLDRLDFGDKPNQDVYDDLVTFGHGSLVLSPQAQQRVLALLQAAKSASSIQLRGRVGYRTLTSETAKQAVGRAVAVRQFLIANGVAKEKVRIHMPRDYDMVNSAAPGDEVNRSVSVFIKVDSTVATAIGLKHGQPISQALKVASAN